MSSDLCSVLPCLSLCPALPRIHTGTPPEHWTIRFSCRTTYTRTIPQPLPVFYPRQARRKRQAATHKHTRPDPDEHEITINTSFFFWRGIILLVFSVTEDPTANGQPQQEVGKASSIRRQRGYSYYWY